MTPASEIDIAYFSMEIAVDPAWPTYAGGLGVLAGDMLRSASMNSEDRPKRTNIGNLKPSWSDSTR